MHKPFPALCKDCRYSKPEEHSEWSLRCTNPLVNAKDPWALTTNSAGIYGTNCRNEREKKWFATCGMKGKLWDVKV